MNKIATRSIWIRLLPTLCPHISQIRIYFFPSDLLLDQLIQARGGHLFKYF